MRIIPDQTLAGTRPDLQGERNSKEVLVRYASAYAGIRLAINQHHDLSLPVIGYIENIRVVPDKASPGDWQLIGNISLDRDETEPLLGGFSFSYMEKLRHSEQQERIEVFLPFPHYNNETLLDEVFEEGFISVGRIVRKEASPETIALVVSVAVAVLQPLWDDVFRAKIAPTVADFFQRRFGTLASRNISCDFIQHIDYAGHSAQVLFIPTRGREAECLSLEKLCSGMFLAADYLNALDLNHVPATKIILTFDRLTSRFSINSVHFSDGTVKTGA